MVRKIKTKTKTLREILDTDYRFAQHLRENEPELYAEYVDFLGQIAQYLWEAIGKCSSYQSRFKEFRVRKAQRGKRGVVVKVRG